MWTDPKLFLVVLAWIFLVLALLVVAGYRSKPRNFTVSYAYDGRPRVWGPLPADRPIPMAHTFATLYEAFGFVKRLTDKGYPSVCLRDNYDDASYLRLELEFTEEQAMQYTVEVGPNFPLLRTHVVRMLHSGALSDELQFQETHQ